MQLANSKSPLSPAEHREPINEGFQAPATFSGCLATQASNHRTQAESTISSRQHHKSARGLGERAVRHHPRSKKHVMFQGTEKSSSPPAAVWKKYDVRQIATTTRGTTSAYGAHAPVRAAQPFDFECVGTPSVGTMFGEQTLYLKP